MIRKINVDDFLNNVVLTNLVINSKENLGVYFKNVLDLDNNDLKREVFVIDILNGFVKKLDIDVNVNDYFFMNEILILKSIEGEETILYTFDIQLELMKRMVSLPFVLKEFAIFDNSIYFLAEIQKNHKNGDVIFSKNCPFYKEGFGVVGESVTALFKSSIDGKLINMISSIDMDIDKIDFDFENQRIAFTAFKSALLKHVDSDVYTYSIETEELNVYTYGGYRIGFIKSMNKENLIFTGINLKTNSRNDIQQMYIVDLQNEKFEMLGENIDISNEESSVITDIRFSSSSPVSKYKEYFYHVRNGRKGEILCKTDLLGNTTYIETDLKTIDSYEVTDKGIFIIGLMGLNLHEIYLLKENVMERITYHNKWIENISLSKAEELLVISDDIEIDGYVFPPVEIEESKKYPGVLFIHGGPKMMYSDVFIHDVQMLCAQGYFVFCSNPRGSDGRGDSFSNIRGKMGDVPYRDLIKFTEAVLEKYPQIDKEKLGVTGGSYGGYMTNYIITKTDMFKCAISEKGISNMITAFTSSDIGYKFVYEYMGNKDTFWTDPNPYMNSSPIMNADKVSTPTLFIHGKNDYRCHYTESLNMYCALNYFGIDSAICIFEGENHSLSDRGRPKSRKRRYDEILKWFNKYLKEEHFNEFN